MSSRVLALALAAAACQAPAPAAITDAERTAIRALDTEFAQKAMAGDYAGLVKSYYAEDAMLLPPNMAAATGHAAIEATLRGFPPVSSFTLTAEEIEGAGDMIYARGRYTMVLNPPGAAAIPDSGKFMEIWRKQADGSWKVTRDMFNSDVPMPAPPPAPAP